MTRHRRLGALAALIPLLIASAPLRPPPQLGALRVPDGWPQAPPATAAAYILLDQATGQVLAERDADVARPVASTVKVLTALSVLRRTRPDDVVTVGAEVVGVGGAGVGLRPGDTWTVGQLLDGLIARSGNDAAVALAVHVGGSVEGFVDLMHEDAHSLGLADVVLATPNGLDDRNRLSARDLGVITRAALADPAFREVAARSVVDLPRVGLQRTRNELLDLYAGATGVKTGFTEAAGYALVGSAARNGRELVVVVLGSASSDQRFTDAIALLDHGFDDFAWHTVAGDLRLRYPGRTIAASLPVTAFLAPVGDDLSVTTTLPGRGGDTAVVDVHWRGALLGTIEVPLAVPTDTPTDPGAWLWSRAYEALRATASARP